MKSRRDSLDALTDPPTITHTGLWLDRYLKEIPLRGSSESTSSYVNFVDSVAAISEPPLYASFFKRWKMQLDTMGALTRDAQVKGRMVIGLGEESVIETAITLHHTYGTPVIPGSALKGLAAYYARNYLDEAQWGVKSQAYCTLFGDVESAGYITFFDALYIPKTGHAHKPLHADVITVHHPDYYQGNDKPPADWDSPNIIPFLSATGSYLVALAGSEAWVNVAFTILEWALAKLGIGAKTSSGYGRIELKPPPFDPGQLHANQLIEQVMRIRERDVAGQIPNYVDRWRKLDVSASLKRQVAKVILEKVRAAGRERADAGKAWYQELLNT